MVRLSKNIRLLEKKDRLLDRFFTEKEKKDLFLFNDVKFKCGRRIFWRNGLYKGREYSG